MLLLFRLPTKQFLHLMFLAGTCRRWHPSINMYNVEYTLEQCLDELSIDEVAIVGAAFFKTQSKIHSTSLLDKIYVKLICNLGIRDLSSVTLSSLLKVILILNSNYSFYSYIIKYTSLFYNNKLFNIVVYFYKRLL